MDNRKKERKAPLKVVFMRSPAVSPSPLQEVEKRSGMTMTILSFPDLQHLRTSSAVVTTGRKRIQPRKQMLISKQEDRGGIPSAISSEQFPQVKMTPTEILNLERGQSELITIENLSVISSEEKITADCLEQVSPNKKIKVEPSEEIFKSEVKEDAETRAPSPFSRPKTPPIKRRRGRPRKTPVRGKSKTKKVLKVSAPDLLEPKIPPIKRTMGRPRSVPANFESVNSTREISSPAPCLVCLKIYDKSPLSVKPRMSIRSPEMKSEAFSLFEKLVLVGNYVCAASTWNFNDEPLPFCSSCTSKLFKLERIHNKLEQVQLELQQQVDMIRTQIIDSFQQNKIDEVTNQQTTGDQSEFLIIPKLESDERVERFRNIVIQQFSTEVKAEPLDDDQSFSPIIDSVMLDDDNIKYEFESNSAYEMDGCPQQDLNINVENDSKGVSNIAGDKNQQFRKKRAAFLLDRFKTVIQKPDGTLTSTTASGRPRRKASLALFKKRSKLGKTTPKSKKSARNFDLNSDSDQDSVSGESDLETHKGKFDKDKEWRLEEQGYRWKRKLKSRNPRSVPEKTPLIFEEVDGQIVYRGVTLPKGETGFTCSLCSAVIGRTRIVVAHVDEHLQTEEELSCTVRRTGKFYYKDAEITKLEDGSKFSCGLCSHEVKSLPQILSHIDRHKGEFPHICEICSKGFFRKVMLERHIKKDHERDWKTCDICGKTYTTSEGLESHKWSHMSKEEAEAAIQAGLKRNIKYKYVPRESSQNNPCPHCGKLYKNKYRCNDHIAFAHSGKTITCKYETCKEVFSSKYLRVLHHLHFHKELKRNYECTECKKVFSCPSELKKHMKGFHKIGRKPNEFQCPICFKELSSVGQLNSHQLVHTDIKKYVCDQCDNSYKRPHALRRHIRKHHSS